MNDPYVGFPEAYETVKTLIVVNETATFKIEVLQNLRSMGVNEFSTRAYVEASIEIPPTSPGNNQRKKLTLWSQLVDFAWVKQGSPETALSQALGFLSDQSKK